MSQLRTPQSKRKRNQDLWTVPLSNSKASTAPVRELVDPNQRSGSHAKAELVLENFAPFLELKSNFDMFSRTSGTREVIACTQSGEFALYSVRADGRSSERLRHVLELDDSTETVTCIRHCGKSLD